MCLRAFDPWPFAVRIKKNKAVREQVGSCLLRAQGDILRSMVGSTTHRPTDWLTNWLDSFMERPPRCEKTKHTTTKNLNFFQEKGRWGGGIGLAVSVFPSRYFRIEPSWKRFKQTKCEVVKQNALMRTRNLRLSIIDVSFLFCVFELDWADGFGLSLPVCSRNRFGVGGGVSKERVQYCQQV